MTDTASAGAPPKGSSAAFAYVTTLFFAWGFATSLIDPLVAAVKRVFDLSYTEAFLTGSAWFIAYGVASLPAAAILSRLVKEVYTVEIHAPLSERATAVHKALGCLGVVTDGSIRVATYLTALPPKEILERKLLDSAGYAADVAVDGMDGWNAVRSGNYDLIITDVDMPRMDGIELATLIKQDENFKSLPVMIVSYKDRDEDRMRGLNAGADYYLTKGSFHDETLIQAVADLIGAADA